MGYGDEIMGSGMAHGARARGKRVALGDGTRILWHRNAHEIFRSNPNVAAPGSEGSADLEWVHHYPGRRVYNRVKNGRWEWIAGYADKPGEVFFSAEELKAAGKQGQGFVLVEPCVPVFKSVAANKQWPRDRYQAVADALAREDGLEIVQLAAPAGIYSPQSTLRGARVAQTRTFREALAVLARANLYVGPEGGLHHGAAAVGTPAVVLFGGFVPPWATGYSSHANLTGGAEACGSLQPCAHCREAMARISPDEVLSAAREKIRGRGELHAA